MPGGTGDSQQEQTIDSGAIPQRKRWLLVATFFVAYLLAVIIAAEIHKSHIASQRLATKVLAQGYAQRIQERVQTALVSTYVLASIVKQSGGRVQNFDDTAAELITLFPSVSALQLAPDGVIREIFPREGNEAAIGHDLLADRNRNREAVAAITTQQLTLAGPFKLVQGGVGAVGRLPIFLNNEQNRSHFWGFAIALIRIPTLLDASGMNGLVNAGYRYELWRIHPETDQREVFARSGDQPLVDPVEYMLTVHNGRWLLSLEPANGWLTTTDYVETFGYSLVAAWVVTLLQHLGIRALLRNRT